MTNSYTRVLKGGVTTNSTHKDIHTIAKPHRGNQIVNSNHVNETNIAILYTKENASERSLAELIGYVINVLLKTTRVAKYPELSDTLHNKKTTLWLSNLSSRINELNLSRENGRTFQLSQLLNNSSKEWTAEGAHANIQKGSIPVV